MRRSVSGGRRGYASNATPKTRTKTRKRAITTPDNKTENGKDALAAGESPLHQFEINTIVPLKLGNMDISFTNSSLMMVITLVLALTDQFPRGLAVRFDEAMTLAGRLADAFERAYYVALICERRAKVHLRQGTPGCGPLAREWLTQAMTRYEEALTLRPTGAEKSLLRFNACVRLMGRYAKLLAQQEPPDAPLLSD